MNKDHIKWEAEQAAERELGPRANRFPEGSLAYKEWLAHYYAKMLELSMEAV